MSDFVLLIGSDEFEVMNSNFELNRQANWQGTLACEIRLDNDATRITARSEFTLKKDGTPWFAGVIAQTPEQGLGGPNLDQIVHHISGVGYETYLTYRYVTETIAAGTTLEDAINTLAAYLPTGVTVDPGQVTGPTLTQDYVFTRTRLDEALKAFTDETGYLARITPDKYFGMYDPTAVSAPFDILDSGPTGPGDGTLYQIGDLRVERTLDDNYANRILGEIRGNGPAVWSQNFVSDGTSTQQFVGDFPASQSINDTWPNVLIVNGDRIGPVGWGTTYTWNWDYVNHKLFTDGTGFVPTAGDIVSIVYAIGYPFYVEGNDLTDQASHPIKEAFVSIDEAMSLAAAQAFVDAEALRRAATIERVLYTTEQMDLEPGMVQTITVAARGINASCLITECRFYTTGDRPGSELLCDVTAVVGTVEAGNVRTTYKDWLRQGGAGPARTGVAGSAVAAPFRSVQFNDDGVFGGSEDVLIDKDFSGQSYGRRARLAVVLDDDNTGDAITIANRTGGLTHGMRLAATDDGGVLLYAAPDSSATYGIKVESSGGGVYITATKGANLNSGLRNTGYICTVGPWVTTECLQPSVWEVTTTPYTIDAYTAGGQPNSAHNESTILWNRSSNGTINLTTIGALTSPNNYISGGSGGYGRIIWVKNVGSATLTLDPTGTEKIYFGTSALSTLDLLPGQGVQIQCYYSTAGGSVPGWHVLASTGFGTSVDGSLPVLSADPASPVDNTFWAVATGTSPTRSIALKVRDAGVTQTLAEITV